MKTNFKDQAIHYSLHNTKLGSMLIASTEKGICCVSFARDAEEELKRRFKGAIFIALDEKSAHHKLHQRAFELVEGWPSTVDLPLHLSGTDFQLAVWKALQNLGPGELSTYRAIAEKAGRPKAIRATGTAIGQNPIAVFIPCHRVISSAGTLGGYRWGIALKEKLIELEMKKS